MTNIHPSDTTMVLADNQPESGKWIGLRIDPFDSLFFRDGRPFNAANRAQSGLPSPQTLAGAVWNFLLVQSGFNFRNIRRVAGTTATMKETLRKAGADQGVIESRFRGPFLALFDDESGKVEPLLAMPASLARAKPIVGGWTRATPAHHVTGWNDPDGLLPLSFSAEPDPKPTEFLLTLTGLKEFLSGGLPSEEEMMERGTLLATDHRVGITIDPDSLATEEGQLYSIGLLTLNDRYRDGSWRLGLYAEILPGSGSSLEPHRHLDGAPIPFGGEGKTVLVSTRNCAEWPQYDSGLERSLWYLATPTFLRPSEHLPRRRLPIAEAPARLVSAASGGGIAVSGWDVQLNGPRPTRFAIPSGACYFLEGGPGKDDDFLFDEDSQIRQNLRQEGWGFALQGVWRNDS